MVENMTPTEKLVAEARELDRMATPGPWKVDKQGRYCDHDECYVELADDSMTINNFIVEGCRYENAEFIAQSRTLIPALCDALEQAQATLEQTWEWDMYKAAQKEIERLRKELAAYEDTGKTPEQIAEWTKAQQEGRLVVLPCKVGDKIYTLSYKGIDEKTVVQLNIQFTDRIKHYSVITHNHRQACLCYENKDFGKTVFLTRAEAEAALKERE
jgi:hypothetical protein